MTTTTVNLNKENESLFSRFCSSISSLWSNEEKETKKAASAGLKIMNLKSPIPELSVKDFKDAQRSVNQIPVKEIDSMEFFKTIDQLNIGDLCDKNALYRFLLLFNYPVNRIHRAFVDHFHAPVGGYDQLKILPFGECTCSCGIRSSENGKEANKRLKLEEEILTQIEQRWGDNRDQKLTLVSVGSGNCLQEWVLISKLLLMGYKNLEIHLLDPVYGIDHEEYGMDDPEIQSHLPRFFSQFPDVQFDFHFHNSLEEFDGENVQTDVLLAIDWDTSSVGKPKVPIKVSQNGFSYVNKWEPHWINTANTQIVSH
jgi:hypothetical protein